MNAFDESLYSGGVHLVQWLLFKSIVSDGAQNVAGTLPCSVAGIGLQVFQTALAQETPQPSPHKRSLQHSLAGRGWALQLMIPTLGENATKERRLGSDIQGFSQYQGVDNILVILTLIQGFSTVATLK